MRTGWTTQYIHSFTLYSLFFLYLLHLTIYIHYYITHFNSLTTLSLSALFYHLVLDDRCVVNLFVRAPFIQLTSTLYFLFYKLKRGALYTSLHFKSIMFFLKSFCFSLLNFEATSASRKLDALTRFRV